MENLLITELIEKVVGYDCSMQNKVYKAYDFACKVHGNQRRKSGELYINHPLQVALILAEQYADSDTICAGLLHDVLEDGDGITLEDLKQEFNEKVAILTDGVTKIPLKHFVNKQEQNNANFRKLIMGIAIDPRIILIKLADRLHNMRTLMYLSRSKQIENSIETLDFYVPLANYYGFQQMKNELEELAFRYLNDDIYQSIQEQRQMIMMEQKDILENISTMIHKKLDNNGINNEVGYRFKRPYAIYQQLTDKAISTSQLLHLKKEDISKIKETQIHDVRSLKILVSQLQECYASEEILINHFCVMEGKQKDCIVNPKTNGYRSLHTTIYDDVKNPIQTKIRTYDMDQFDTLGFVSYWKQYGSTAHIKMREDLVTKCQFYSTLVELNSTFSKNQDFVQHVKKEILTNMIYPKTMEGKVVELPIGATVLDFALKINYPFHSNSIIAFVNGKQVPLNAPLPKKAIVEIVPSHERQFVGSLYSCAITTYARQRIKKFKNG